MQRRIEKVFFALIRFEINGSELCDDVKNLITPEVLPALFKLSKRHDLAHLIGDALDKKGLLPDGTEAKKRFIQERNMAVYRYEQMQYEFEQICETMEKVAIPFIPLKGSVIRQYYPEPWMRTSCDIDILVHKDHLQKALTVLKQKLKYKQEAGCDHHESLYSESGVHLELHYTLLSDTYNGKAFEILKNIWEYVEHKNGKKFEFEMTNEMFYFYHIVHMAKHFQFGGCGIKPFLDILIIEKNMPIDMEKRDMLLEQGAMLLFADNARKLVNAWFCEGMHTEITLQMEEYIIRGGVYGTIGNRVVVQQAKKGGKVRYAISRIFLPYKNLKYLYPIIKKHKWLTPVFQVVRWFRIVFKGNAQKSAWEFKVNASISAEERNRTIKLLNELGLAKE